MGTSTTETTKQEMDPFQKASLEYGFNYGKGVAEKPFETYTGPTVAGLTDFETSLLDRYRGLDTGGSAYKTARDVAAGIAQETPADRAARIGQYSQDYTAGVIDPTLALMERERAKQRVGEQATRTAAKAFGSRGDVYQGALEGEYQSNISKTVADLMQRGMDYGTARASAETQERLGAAGQLASTAGAGLQAELAGLGAMSGAAALPRQLEQQRLDFLLSEFMREQNLPYMNAQMLQGMMSAIPTGYGTTTATKETGGLGPTLGALGSAGMAMSGFGGLGGFGSMIGNSPLANPLFGGSTFGVGGYR